MLSTFVRVYLRRRQNTIRLNIAPIELKLFPIAITTLSILYPAHSDYFSLFPPTLTSYFQKAN